jgi:hypothetical protein
VNLNDIYLLVNVVWTCLIRLLCTRELRTRVMHLCYMGLCVICKQIEENLMLYGAI